MITDHRLDPQMAMLHSQLVHARVIIIHLASDWLTHAGSQGFVEERAVPFDMKFYHFDVHISVTEHVTCVSVRTSFKDFMVDRQRGAFVLWR